MNSPIPLDLLKRFAPMVLELAKSKGGDNPLVGQIVSAASGLLGQHPDPAAKPVKQQLDSGVAEALAALHKAGQEAREAVKYRPSNG